MATQTVEFSAPPEQTITAKLFAAGSDTVVQTASGVAEATNRAGVYSATFTDAAAGVYRLIATDAGGTPLAQWWVDLTLTTATFQSYEVPVSVMQSGLSTFDAGSDTVTVGSASRDAIVAEFLAHVISKGDAGTIERAFWQAAKSQASAEGEVSGTPTVSAFDTDLTAVTGAFDDLLILFVSGSLTGEARPIASYDNTDGRITLQESLTAAPSAADEFLIIPSHTHPIADIQNGLATSAALATVDSLVDLLVSRSGYQMSILAGAISNAQGAAEAYSITLDGSTYSVTYSGLDASGNRSGATLVTT